MVSLDTAPSSYPSSNPSPTPSPARVERPTPFPLAPKSSTAADPLVARLAHPARPAPPCTAPAVHSAARHALNPAARGRHSARHGREKSCARPRPARIGALAGHSAVQVAWDRVLDAGDGRRSAHGDCDESGRRAARRVVQCSCTARLCCPFWRPCQALCRHQHIPPSRMES